MSLGDRLRGLKAPVDRRRIDRVELLIGQSLRHRASLLATFLAQRDVFHPAAQLLPGVLRDRVPNQKQDRHASDFSMPSRALGFSREDRSPRSSPRALARIARRKILAERVLGSSSTNRM